MCPYVSVCTCACVCIYMCADFACMHVYLNVCVCQCIHVWCVCMFMCMCVCCAHMHMWRTGSEAFYFETMVVTSPAARVISWVPGSIPACGLAPHPVFFSSCPFVPSSQLVAFCGFLFLFAKSNVFLNQIMYDKQSSRFSLIPVMNKALRLLFLLALGGCSYSFGHYMVFMCYLLKKCLIKIRKTTTQTRCL